MVKLKIAAIALFITAVGTFAIFPRSRNSVTAAPPVPQDKVQGMDHGGSADFLPHPSRHALLSLQVVACAGGRPAN
jgi:hypothetical protein